MEGRINEFVFPLAAMKHAQGGSKSGKLSLEFTNLLRQHGIIAPKAEEKNGDRRQLAEKASTACAQRRSRSCAWPEYRRTSAGTSWAMTPKK